MGDVQPQPQPSANSSSRRAPLSDEDLSLLFPQRPPEKYHEADAARVIMELKMYMERLLPNHKGNYQLRSTGYLVMYEINDDIERGIMDDEKWAVHAMEAACVFATHVGISWVSNSFCCSTKSP